METTVLSITRLAPGDQRVAVQGSFSGPIRREEVEYVFRLQRRGSGSVEHRRLVGEAPAIEWTGLQNGVDYQLELTAYHRRTGAALAAAPTRLFRPGWVPGVSVNYIHPDDYTFNTSGRSPASPSLLRLPQGRLLASHDIFWGQGGQNLTKVFYSDDEGRSWAYLSTVYPCFWGTLFLHRDRVYMLAVSTEYGQLQIFGSPDSGRTWTRPVRILPGGSREAGGPHKAPVPLIRQNGRLWSAVEYGSWQTGGHAAGVVSVPEDTDLLSPDAWTVSAFTDCDPAWPGAVRGGAPGILEGNVVAAPNGELVNVLRYHTKGAVPDYGRAVILTVDSHRPHAAPAFRQVVDFPGSMSKFCIRFHAQTERYYALVNRVTTDWVSQRNVLSLISSSDIVHWDIHRDLLNYEDNGWPEDKHQVGFQYVDWLFQDDDIWALSRTALNGAYNYHNANHLTFHKFARKTRGRSV